MPPRTRRSAQPRGGRRAQASTARRRVRATSNANNVGAMAAYRRKYRATKSAGHRVGALHRQMRKMSAAGLLWALITLIIAVTAVLIESAGTAAAAGISLGVTAGVEKYQRRKGRSSVPPPRQQTPVSRGSGGSRSSGGTAGTGPKGKPKSTPVNLNGATSGGRTKVCGKACRESSKPKNTCRCTAPDCQHGTEATAGAKP